jgi:hypothetical protein
MDETTIRHILERQASSLKHGNLTVWTIYAHPADFPHSYVARRFEVGKGAEPIATADIIQGELHAIRASFEVAGLYCIRRNHTDEPQIVETWL